MMKSEDLFLRGVLEYSSDPVRIIQGLLLWFFILWLIRNAWHRAGGDRSVCSIKRLVLLGATVQFTYMIVFDGIIQLDVHPLAQRRSLSNVGIQACIFWFVAFILFYAIAAYGWITRKGIEAIANWIRLWNHRNPDASGLYPRGVSSFVLGVIVGTASGLIAASMLNTRYKTSEAAWGLIRVDSWTGRTWVMGQSTGGSWRKIPDTPPE